MSRRLLQRQSSSSMDVDQPADLSNRPLNELWLRSENKKKTSETTKIQEKDLPAVVETISNTPTTSQSSVDILCLSPNISSPASIRGQDDDQSNSLLNQLQVRRARPEHSPSDLSPNFSPSFSPRFVPQSRPRTLLAYLQNFGQNSQNVPQSTGQNNSSAAQGDPRRTAVSFFSRIFGNNPPTAPQNFQGNQTTINNDQAQNTDEAVSTSNELVSYQQPQHQITNTITNFPHGAIIVRTVQSGPNGSVVVNMRVLSLDDLLNQHEDFNGLEAGNSGLFGSLLNILAGLQGNNMFTFSDISSFLNQDRGLDKDTIRSLPAVTYEEEAFKNVDDESKKCTICLEHFEDGNEVKYLWCLHRFHTQCVDKWLDDHSNCPVCKKDFSESEEISE